jgi:hypothetical protein
MSYMVAAKRQVIPVRLERLSAGYAENHTDVDVKALQFIGMSSASHDVIQGTG